MKYRLDPRSGKELSVLGFGCMRFPRRAVATDKEKVEKLIISAIERGVNYFDTAYIYPESEAVLGEVLAKNNVRSKVYLATKLPHGRCKSIEDAEKIFSEQLSRLRTDHIDYYLIHNISKPESWGKLKAIGIEEWIAAKKQNGQIGQIGFSFHGSQDEYMQLLDAYDWDFVQIQYNYMDENYQAGRAGVEKAAQKGLPVIVMEPLLGGKLATGLPREVDKIFKAANPERSAVSWAMSWLLDQSAVTVVLSGMNAMEQLDENIAIADLSEPGMLSAQEAAVFEPVAEAFKRHYKVDCTGCNYCMPCPSGVNIPGCFSAYNARYAMGYYAGMQMYVLNSGMSNKKGSNARSCTKCGACEKKCPQHIRIIAELEAVAKKMEPWYVRGAMAVVRKFM